MAGAIALCGLLVSSRGRAAPSARLVYVRDTGAEDCPDENAVRAAVATRLGYEPFFPYASATLYAEVSRSNGMYRAKVKLVDATNTVRGARDLEHRGSACSDIVDAMALSMSIAIDPRSLLEPRLAEEPAPVVESAPVPEPVAEAFISQSASPPAAEKPVRAPPRTLEPIVGVAFAGWADAAPAPTAGVLAFGGVRTGPWGVFLEGRADLSAARHVNAGSVATSFAGGALVPCWMYGWFLGCAVGTVGQLEARSEGIAKPRDSAAVHVLAGGRAGLSLPVTSRVDLRLAADVLYVLTPHRLQIDAETVYELPRVALGLSAGAGVRFP